MKTKIHTAKKLNKSNKYKEILIQIHSIQTAEKQNQNLEISKRKPFIRYSGILTIFSHQTQGRSWEFPGGPVVRTQHVHCRNPGVTNSYAYYNS